MNFSRYSGYKDSGVAWLGEVPSHWTTQRCRFLFEIKKRIAGEEGHDILSITQQGIRVKDIDSNDGQLSQDYSKYQLVFPGDFAMNHMDLLTGYVDVSAVSGVTSPDYRVFSLRDEQSGVAAYFLYVFQNAYKQRILYAYGQGSSQLGRWRLPTDQFNDFSLPYPPAPEQSTIAAFLDRETGKIDALVAEQEKLIELLKEKRQAVISHAVTKGLDPSVPKKDSGIPWLGEVPAHWEIVPLKRVVVLQRGYDLPADERETGGVPVVSSGGVIASHNIAQAKGPGIVTGRYGTIGEFVFVDEDYWPLNTALFSSEMHGEPRYIWFMLQGVSELFVLNSLKSAVPGVDRNDVHTVLVGRPPRPEQIEIAAFLNAETQRIDVLITEAQRAIDLLKERRSALISAAVTGKIDVRGLVEEEAA